MLQPLLRRVPSHFVMQTAAGVAFEPGEARLSLSHQQWLPVVRGRAPQRVGRGVCGSESPEMAVKVQIPGLHPRATESTSLGSSEIFSRRRRGVIIIIIFYMNARCRVVWAMPNKKGARHSSVI